VSLYERDSVEADRTLRYRATLGFSGALNDTSYRCVARAHGQERTSQTFYVFSIIGLLPYHPNPNPRPGISPTTSSSLPVALYQQLSKKPVDISIQSDAQTRPLLTQNDDVPISCELDELLSSLTRDEEL